MLFTVGNRIRFGNKYGTIIEIRHSEGMPCTYIIDFDLMIYDNVPGDNVPGTCQLGIVSIPSTIDIELIT